jgi:hypothetical protein
MKAAFLVSGWVLTGALLGWTVGDLGPTLYLFATGVPYYDRSLGPTLGILFEGMRLGGAFCGAGLGAVAGMLAVRAVKRQGSKQAPGGGLRIRPYQSVAGGQGDTTDESGVEEKANRR